MVAASARLRGNDAGTRSSSAAQRSHTAQAACPTYPARRSTPRRILAVTLAGTGLLCGLLAAPATAAGLRGDPETGREKAAEEFIPTGKTWERTGTDVTEAYRVTQPRQGRRPGTPEHHAIRTWQELLNEHGLPVQIDGVYHEDTERAVRAFQSRRGMPVTGRIDYPTARALLERTIKREAAAAGISPDLLCGHLDLESRLDPATVGPTGDDLGLGQILMGRWNPGISVADALDEDFAIRYMARRDAAAYRQFGDWRIAVFSYYHPAGAEAWKRTGRPAPRGRWYSETVLRGCSGPEFPGERVTDLPARDDRLVLRSSSADLGRWLSELLTSVGDDWEMGGSPAAAKPGKIQAAGS